MSRRRRCAFLLDCDAWRGGYPHRLYVSPWCAMRDSSVLERIGCEVSRGVGVTDANANVACERVHVNIVECGSNIEMSNTRDAHVQPLAHHVQTSAAEGALVMGQMRAKARYREHPLRTKHRTWPSRQRTPQIPTLWLLELTMRDLRHHIRAAALCARNLHMSRRTQETHVPSPGG